VGCGCLLLLLTQLLLLDRIMIAAAAPCNLPNYIVARAVQSGTPK
jgi:hypothetical protein